jgi:hypothetical protein
MTNSSLYNALERFWKNISARLDHERKNAERNTLEQLYGYSEDELYVYPEGTTTLKSLAGNTTIKCVVIPKSVKYIPSGTFTGCTNLEVVKVFGSLGYIDQEAFKGCTNLNTIEYLNKKPDGSPDTAAAIYGNAFNSCGLTDIDVSNTITFNGAIFGNSLNTVAVKVADLATWQNKTFTVASSNPLFYGRYLYENGQRVTNLDLCGKWTTSSIGKYAFVGGQFTNIKIPKCVTTIGSRAFDKNFESYTVDLTDYDLFDEFPSIQSDTFVGAGKGKAPAKILVPAGRKGELMSMTNWSKWATDSVVEEVVTMSGSVNNAGSVIGTAIYMDAEASMWGGDFSKIAVVDPEQNMIGWEDPSSVLVGYATTLSALAASGGWTTYHNSDTFTGAAGVYLVRIVSTEGNGSISAMMFIEIPSELSDCAVTFCQSVGGTSLLPDHKTVHASISWNDADSYVEVHICERKPDGTSTYVGEDIFIQVKKLG